MIRLNQVLKGLTYEVLKGDLEKEIREICYHSNKVTKTSLFVCIRGSERDAHLFLEEAYMAGAEAFVVWKEYTKIEGVQTLVENLLKKENITIITVEDTEIALAILCSNYFGNPANKLTLIGVTGTKGKTTTTHMIYEILNKAGISTGLIGSIGIRMKEENLATDNTTPDSYVLHSIFRKMLDLGITTVVMEVSSQALKRHRTYGLVYEIGVFTNLEEDHIGPSEHADFKEYLEAKSLLFLQCKKAVVNGDDPYALQVLGKSGCTAKSYGLNPGNDLRAKDLRLQKDGEHLGICFMLEGSAKGVIRLSIPGTFNVYNGLAAILVCKEMGVAREVYEKVLSTFRVRGRMEGMKTQRGAILLIDYAHNGMALRTALLALREYQPKRLICIFGCGGNRARNRRYEMGKASGEEADLSILTSDNPRKEKPEAIIEDILVGIKETTGRYRIIPDRREAIKEALLEAGEGDILLLAGKGHEVYQEIQGVKYPMDERTLIKEAEEILRR